MRSFLFWWNGFGLKPTLLWCYINFCKSLRRLWSSNISLYCNYCISAWTGRNVFLKNSQNIFVRLKTWDVNFRRYFTKTRRREMYPIPFCQHPSAPQRKLNNNPKKTDIKSTINIPRRCRESFKRVITSVHFVRSSNTAGDETREAWRHHWTETQGGQQWTGQLALKPEN